MGYETSELWNVNFYCSLNRNGKYTYMRDRMRTIKEICKYINHQYLRPKIWEGLEFLCLNDFQLLYKKKILNDTFFDRNDG